MLGRASLTIWHQQTIYCHCRAPYSSLSVSISLITHLLSPAIAVPHPLNTHPEWDAHTKNSCVCSVEGLLAEQRLPFLLPNRSPVTDCFLEEKGRFGEFTGRCRYAFQSLCLPQSPAVLVARPLCLNLCPLRRRQTVCHLFLNFVTALQRST